VKTLSIPVIPDGERALWWWVWKRTFNLSQWV